MLKAQIIGNLGNDPESRFTPAGQAILTFNVASNYRVKNGMGNYDDATEWVRVTIFGKRAETLATILKKGMRVFCDGRLECRPWQGRDGSPRAGLEMVANDVEFLSSRSGEDGQRAAAPVGAGKPAETPDDRTELADLPF